MKNAIAAVNQLKADGVISEYAIGGAVATMQYIEATATEDIDVFVLLDPKPGQLLVTLDAIYPALEAQGGIVEGPYVRFGDWPLQILSPTSGLMTEAVRAAAPATLHGEPTRAFTAEHVCAAALDVYRMKDRLRVASFLEAGKVDIAKLEELATRYGLLEKLRKIQHAD